ncbi:LacI family DNA-binding transcriptional regulator [Paenibacillus solisilvae]|uniref:LacI family DNA-binding transcriptional regulator n=1 Tax=Paenibacillus solisilvae TaxID=2486751 RepID=A0ABW0W2B3_9BACL
MTITIKHIADKAGVSRGTVDRVLNGRTGVKPEVRERVLAIAKEMDYSPNVAAKALAYSKKPILFGVVMPPREISFFDEVRRGIQNAADELKDLGIRLEYEYVNNRKQEESAAAIDKLVEMGADGILFSAMDNDLTRASIDRAVKQGVPVVTFNSDVENSSRVCFIGQDLPKSGRIAAGLLSRILKADSKVLVVTGSLNFHAHRSRVKSFQDNLQQTRSDIEIVNVVEGFDQYELTFSQIDQALHQEPGIEGIYMATGDVGACIDAIKRHGKEGKVKVVCNDLLPETERGMKEGIIDFTIVQNPSMQGYRALRILFDHRFLGKPPEIEYYFTETNIMIPESM